MPYRGHVFQSNNAKYSWSDSAMEYTNARMYTRLYQGVQCPQDLKPNGQGKNITDTVEYGY